MNEMTHLNDRIPAFCDTNLVPATSPASTGAASWRSWHTAL